MLKQYSNLTSSPKVEIVTKTVQLNYICVKATFSLYDSQDNFGRTYFQVVLSNMTDNAILSLYQLTPTNLNDINESNINTYLNNLISLWQVSKKDEPFYETIDITKLVQNNKSSSSFSIYFIVSFDPLDKLTFDIPSKTEKIIFGELYNPNHESYIHEKIEQDIGYVGKGSVDLYNLSLFFQIINVSTTGKAPVTLSTIYNEKRSGFFGEHCPADFEYNALVLDDYVLIENPIGDHLYYQKTTVEELKNKYHLKPFKESGSFYINITDYSYIIFSPNKVNFSIINKDNSRIEFNGYTLDKKILTPLSIVRKVTSKTTIEYISSNNKVISIKSNDNDVINLIYNNNNLISKIVYGKMNYLLLEYTSINGKFLLSTVKYCNNNNPTEKEIVQNVAKYEYQSLAPYLLTFAYDKDTLQGYSYEYLNNKIHDISSKLYLSSSVNQSINIINKNNITTITNQLNEATYYYFDNYGLCYLKSDQYGNVLMKKYQDSDIGRYPYNIGESNLEKNVCDILLNGNFDNEDIEEDFKWKIEQNSIGNIEKSLGFNGKKSLRIYNITSSTFEIYETIENINSYIGKTIYFKGYVRGKGTISIKIKLDNNNYVINKDLNNIWEDIYINDINLSNTKSIKVSIIASKETDVRLSNFSLCLDEASTRDNFINNGKFNDLTTNWNMKNFTDNDIVTNQVLLEPLNKIFSKAIKITGKIDQVKSIEQKIDLSGGALEELLFSFFSKVDISRNDYFVSYIKVEYINLKEKVYSFDINRNIYEYQLVSQSIITLDAYKSVTIGLEYRGKNTIYLSDFGLYKESFGSYYSYSKQNTLTEIASGTATTNLDIDDNSRLKRIVDATGEIYQYEYDNIVKITDSSGNEFSFSYDDNNFLCKTLITTKNKKTISSTKTNDENGNILLMKDYDGTTQAFEYDDKDRLIKANSSRGIVNHYQYDDKDRIEKKIYDIETETITHQFNYNKYDNYNKISIEDIQSYNYNQYDSWGNYKEIRLDNEILTKLNYYVYSNYYTGLISNKIYPNGTYTFTYDSLNRLQKITYIDKDIVSYNYDKYNKLTNKTEVNRNDEQDIYVTTYSYDKDQNVIKKQIKSKFLSEVTLNEYDNLGNIQQKSIIPDSLEILNYNYVYDYEYNEYKSGGYFSRLETSFLEDIVFEDTILKYGEAPILNSVNLEKDISINRKVIKFTKNTSSLAFQTSSINCNRMKISDGNDSFNEEEWQNKFKTYKELYVWVRIDSLTNSTSLEKIISLGDDTKEIANVSIKNNGEVIYSYNNQEVSTFWIKAKEWNLIGLALEETTLSTKLHYFINQYYNSCDLSGKYVSNITRIMFGNYHNSNVTNEQLSGGTLLSMPFDILYIGIGTYSHNQESYRGIYNEGYKYVFSRDVNPSSGVIYYNHNAYKGMDVIPLNGNLTSIKGLKPLEYTYQDNSFKIKKTKLFKLDNKRFEDDKEYTNRHIYGSYKEEIGLEGKNKSLLAYDFGLKKEGTISLRFKCDFISGYQRYLTRTILCSPTKDNGSHKLVVYIDNDNEKIKIGINRHTFSTTLNVLPETWHLFTIMGYI